MASGHLPAEFVHDPEADREVTLPKDGLAKRVSGHVYERAGRIFHEERAENDMTITDPEKTLLAREAAGAKVFREKKGGK